MPDLIDRLAAHIRLAPNGCWIWTGGLVRGGYGKVWVDGQTLTAPRVAYEALVGPVPEGHTLDHVVCQAPPCINPDHLEPVLHRENLRRSRNHIAIKMAQTQCLHGHPLEGENLYLTPQGSRRQCRACMRRRQAAYVARRKGGTQNP